jgi:hypothetical protein
MGRIREPDKDAEWKEVTHDEPDEEKATPELMVYTEPELLVESERLPRAGSEVTEEEESVGELIDVEVEVEVKVEVETRVETEETDADVEILDVDVSGVVYTR